MIFYIHIYKIYWIFTKKPFQVKPGLNYFAQSSENITKYSRHLKKYIETVANKIQMPVWITQSIIIIPHLKNSEIQSSSTFPENPSFFLVAEKH